MSRNNPNRRSASSNSSKSTNNRISLEDKIKIHGGSNGYALELVDQSCKTPYHHQRGGRKRKSSYSTTSKTTPRDAYGRPKRNEDASLTSNPTDRLTTSTNDTVTRTFHRNRTSSNHNGTNIATPGYIHQQSSSTSTSLNDATMSTSKRTPHNPYKTKRAPPSSAKFARSHNQSHSSKHIICSISENLARETCITTMDATSPTTIEVHKMANGQTYIETLSYLEMMNPHEVLLNEGRRNSQLCRKIVDLFHDVNDGLEYDDYDDNLTMDDDENYGGGVLNDVTNTTTVKRKRGKKGGGGNSQQRQGGGRKKQNHDNYQTPTSRRTRNQKETIKNGECEIQTVVKFLPRSYFDQTRGAEILERVALDTSYDPSIINEYIVLSSSYSLVSYLQSCLGSNFNRNSLRIAMNWGGKYRMAIDRNTISHLELLANAQTGKNKNSLIGTIDCTKTNVGSRLLRSNLMSPPTGIATINARLDLVDSFLEDESFFYEVLEQLQALPDVDKMIAHISMSPNKQRLTRTKRGGGKPRQVTARMASRGISALVCIKSTLSVIPNFARVLEIQLQSMSKSNNIAQDGRKDDTGSTTSTAFGGNTWTTSSQSCSEKRKSNNSDDEESRSSKSDETDMLETEADPSDNVTTKDDVRTQRSNSTSRNHVKDDMKSMNTNASNSLLIGLGGGETPSETQSSNHQLLRAILMTMKVPALQEILDSVLNIFTESTTYSRNSHAMRHQECFALKPNTDGMMDVLRKAFLANVDDIYKLADQYSQTYGITVAVKETTARGYYLSIPVAQVGSDLPNIFIQPVKSGKHFNCTSEEVLSLNSRAQENVQDLLLMTHERIQECIEGARQKFDALASLSDAIALIDMCHCFADNVVCSRQPWCRPIVTDCCGSMNGNDEPQNGIIGSGAIAIRNGRFAIDVSKTGLMVSEDGETKADFIPNDTYASAFQNFTVITGINGSGKSTYLKQIAITVILAHCGSYVPAEEAYIPVRDRICTRIGTTDDQEHNISTFMQEMKDTAFICKNATDKSLILIDELGRATSNEDGVAIAWAIGEFLLVKRAMTFFVTHYPQLCRMAEIYPNVQNQHLGTLSEENSDQVMYTHKIMPGPCRMSADYGVDMAATCGWEQDVMQLAKAVRSEVESKLPDGVLCQQTTCETNVDMIAVRNKAESILNNLAKHLVALKASENRLDKAARRSYLQDLREQFVETDDENVIRMIKSLLLEENETVSPKLPLHPEGLLCLRANNNSDENEDVILQLENSESNQTEAVSSVNMNAMEVDKSNDQIKDQTMDLFKDDILSEVHNSNESKRQGRSDRISLVQYNAISASSRAFEAMKDPNESSKINTTEKEVIDIDNYSSSSSSSSDDDSSTSSSSTSSSGESGSSSSGSSNFTSDTDSVVSIKDKNLKAHAE